MTEKKVKFYTLGCKVNQYETQSLREQFLNAGFSESAGENADIYVVNTCTVTAHADRECRRLIHHAAKINPRVPIVVTGCFTKEDAQELGRLSAKICLVPNQHKHHIVDFLNRIHPVRFNPAKGAFSPLRISFFAGHQRAFIKIQDGCDNFCAYCKVPFVRGRSRSRSLKEIINEAALLRERGFKEIVLTGICLGDYRYKELNLSDVLKALVKLPGEFRVRLSSVEPDLVDTALIKALSLPKACPHLHLPLQSGDDAILKKMNRRYTVKSYLSLVEKIRKNIADVAITTDVLVGFPQEDERNFANTVRCLKELVPLRTHIFSFSPRPGTAAFSLPGQVAPQIIRARMRELKTVCAHCSYTFRKQFLKKYLVTLIESQPDKKTGFLTGYTQNYIRVFLENATPDDVNHFARTQLRKVGGDITIARLSTGGNR